MQSLHTVFMNDLASMSIRFPSILLLTTSDSNSYLTTEMANYTKPDLVIFV